jgi:predicted phosphodiesterase
MEERAKASAEFPLLCETVIPPGDANIDVITANKPAEHFPIPKITYDPQRILVIGDTGCRLKGSLVQPCNDERQWPFANIARKAAELKPDLVIHVGDYLYRENACPANEAGCQGTPFGDNWPTWAADFFTPGQPLLVAAPWVFVRGNHEDCQRAGPGWTRLLAPARFDPAKACEDHTAPFAVPLKDMTLVVLDNANAPDTAVDESAVPVYRQDLAAISTVQAPVWALMHRPIWAAVSGPLNVPIGGNATEIEAAGKNGIGKPVELLLAGHIHTFEAINYADNKVPPQIVAGGGGDLLDKTPEDLVGTIFQGSSGVSVKDGLSINGFSYLLMTKAANSWRIDVYDQDGIVARHCAFAGGRVDCPAAKK